MRRGGRVECSTEGTHGWRTWVRVRWRCGDRRRHAELCGRIRKKQTALFPLGHGVRLATGRGPKMAATSHSIKPTQKPLSTRRPIRRYSRKAMPTKCLAVHYFTKTAAAVLPFFIKLATLFHTVPAVDDKKWKERGVIRYRLGERLVPRHRIRRNTFRHKSRCTRWQTWKLITRIYSHSKKTGQSHNALLVSLHMATLQQVVTKRDIRSNTISQHMESAKAQWC